MNLSRRLPAWLFDQRLHRWAVLVLLVLLPVRAITITGSGSLNLGFLGALLVAPLAVRALRHRVHEPLLGWVSMATLVLGPVWAYLSHLSGRSVDVGNAIALYLLLGSVILTVLMVVWGRALDMSLGWIAIAYALGLALHAATKPDTFEINAWKFGFAVPVALAAFAVCQWLRWPWSPVVVAALLAAVNVLSDYRSFLGLLAAVALAVCFRKALNRGRGRPWLLGTGVLLTALALYQLVVWASLMGWLGERNRVVTEAQIAGNGLALAGARSEWFATIALFRHFPLGFGPGAVPTRTDLAIGDSAMRMAGQTTSVDHVYRYMFGARFELHSILADFWAHFGIPGILWTLLLAGVVLAGTFRALDRSENLSLQVFAGVLALWDLAFSPIGTNLAEVAIAVGLFLPLRPVHPERVVPDEPRVEAGTFEDPSE